MIQLLAPDEKKRISVDEDIYLSQNRFEKPKEIFKSISSIIKDHNFPEQMSICDMGCATGEFLYYFKTLFPKCSVTGFDISKSMLELAKKMIPNGNFTEGNVNSTQSFLKDTYDVVTMTGVLSIFDDPRQSLTNCLSSIKKNGVVIISGSFNPHPIDVILRYRKSDSPESTMESGWNVHSCNTVEKIVKDISPTAKCSWHDFHMPFSIKQTSDLMRTWTVKIDNDIALVNGASQIVNMKILEITQ